MALAAGSTIAGNFLILGAASNVIIIQNAEKEGETLSFAEFFQNWSFNYLFRRYYLFYLSLDLKSNKFSLNKNKTLFLA